MWERFAEHGPTMMAACSLTSIAAMAIEVKRWRRSRTRRGCGDCVLACASSGLLGFVGAITPAGLGAWMLPDSPWPVVAVAVPVGLAVNLAKEAGPLRLLRLSLSALGRVSRSLAQEIGSDSSPPSDSDAS